MLDQENELSKRRLEAAALISDREEACRELEKVSVIERIGVCFSVVFCSGCGLGGYIFSCGALAFPVGLSFPFCFVCFMVFVQVCVVLCAGPRVSRDPCAAKSPLCV